mgnify:CR=1 FL=1
MFVSSFLGPKVVSKTISLSSIKELTRVLRRPPLIWDNIHANDKGRGWQRSQTSHVINGDEKM